MALNAILKPIFMIWAYAGWFFCVLAGKNGIGALVLLGPVVSWVLFIQALRPTKIICAKLLALAAFGFLFDALALRLQWISILDSGAFPPVWLFALWLHFAPTIVLLKLIFGRRIWLGAVAGAILGPLSYKSGEAFDVLNFSDPFAPLYYAIFWACFVPGSIYFLHEKDRKHGNS